MRHTGTAIVLTVLGGVATAAPGDPDEDLSRLREDARAAMKPCGRCHDSTQKTAMEKALHCFDLHAEEWARPLKPSTWAGIEKRFDNLKLPPSELGRVKAYLDAEWARRAALPSEVRDRERAP